MIRLWLSTTWNQSGSWFHTKRAWSYLLKFWDSQKNPASSELWHVDMVTCYWDPGILSLAFVQLEILLAGTKKNLPELNQSQVPSSVQMTYQSNNIRSKFQIELEHLAGQRDHSLRINENIIYVTHTFDKNVNLWCSLQEVLLSGGDAESSSHLHSQLQTPKSLSWVGLKQEVLGPDLLCVNKNMQADRP